MDDIRFRAEKIKNNVSSVFGKDQAVDQILTALHCGCHVLIEDVRDRFIPMLFWLMKSIERPREPSRLFLTMEENQVSIDGEIRALPNPFFSTKRLNRREIGEFRALMKIIIHF